MHIEASDGNLENRTRSVALSRRKLLTECVLEVIRSNLQSAYVVKSRDLENMDSLNHMQQASLY